MFIDAAVPRRTLRHGRTHGTGCDEKHMKEIENPCAIASSTFARKPEELLDTCRPHIRTTAARPAPPENGSLLSRS